VPRLGRHAFVGRRRLQREGLHHLPNMLGECRLLFASAACRVARLGDPIQDAPNAGALSWGLQAAPFVHPLHGRNVLPDGREAYILGTLGQVRREELLGGRERVGAALLAPGDEEAPLGAVHAPGRGPSVLLGELSDPLGVLQGDALGELGRRLGARVGRF